MSFMPSNQPTPVEEIPPNNAFAHGPALHSSNTNLTSSNSNADTPAPTSTDVDHSNSQNTNNSDVLSNSFSNAPFAKTSDHSTGSNPQPSAAPPSYNPASASPPPFNPASATSNTASHQHQQEQEMLSGFAIPNPPVSTQQSSVAAERDAAGNFSNTGAGNGATGHNGPSGAGGPDSISDGSISGHSDAPRTLWMGDLDPWLDENAITDLWLKILNKRVSVKIIKPRHNKPDVEYMGLSHSGYCFVEFESFDDAQQALGLNGLLLPDIALPSQQQFPKNPDNQKKYFRLNWASGATLSAPIIQTPEFSLFVGDLSASTTEAHLLAFFQKQFPTSIKTVRVMTDPVSGKSRCFGFVRFTDESERQRALVEMNGAWFGGRPLRVALATPRNNSNNNNANANNSDSNLGNPNFFQGPMPAGGYGSGGNYRNRINTPNSFRPGSIGLRSSLSGDQLDYSGGGGINKNSNTNAGMYGDTDLMFLPPPDAAGSGAQIPPRGIGHSPYRFYGTPPSHGAHLPPPHQQHQHFASGNNSGGAGINTDNVSGSDGNTPPASGNYGNDFALGPTGANLDDEPSVDDNPGFGFAANGYPAGSNAGGFKNANLDQYGGLQGFRNINNLSNDTYGIGPPPSGAIGSGPSYSPGLRQFPANPQGQPFTDPKNTTVFVGGLSSEVTEATLFTLFKPFGVIQQVKIPPGKNCGFIKYTTREEAEEAIGAMQGFIIGGNRIRLSWGRVSINNKKYQQQQQQVAQAAQMQAAAALSMGMDPASAIAAAAAAAAGGYPPPPPRGGPPHAHGPPGGHPGALAGLPLQNYGSGVNIPPPLGIPPPILPGGSYSNLQNDGAAPPYVGGGGSISGEAHSDVKSANGGENDDQGRMGASTSNQSGGLPLPLPPPPPGSGSGVGSGIPPHSNPYYGGFPPHLAAGGPPSHGPPVANDFNYYNNSGTGAPGAPGFLDGRFASGANPDDLINTMASMNLRGDNDTGGNTTSAPNSESGDAVIKHDLNPRHQSHHQQQQIPSGSVGPGMFIPPPIYNGGFPVQEYGQFVPQVPSDYYYQQGRHTGGGLTNPLPDQTPRYPQSTSSQQQEGSEGAGDEVKV